MTWIYRITTCHCIDELRRREKQSRWRSLYAAQALAIPAAGEGMTLLRQILARADAREAAAAVYVFVDQLTYEEAAPLLGVSKRTVGNLVERFIDNARRFTDGENDATLPQLIATAAHEGGI